MRPLLRRRASHIVMLASGLLGGWVASVAAADLPPLPPVPPVAQVPTLPVLPPAPPPRVPQLPPAPVAVPKAPPVGSVPSIVQAPQPRGAAPSAGVQTSAPTSGAQRRSSAAAPRPVRVHWLHFSRDWIARSGSKKQQRTVLVFVLQRAALVEFGVVQVSPECRPVGHFRVQGRLGLNRVRFQGRIGRTVLGPGTYRIQASAGGQRVSPDGRDGSVRLHQDVALYTTMLTPGEKISAALGAGRSAWLQVSRGVAAVNGLRLEEGDGAAITGETQLDLSAPDHTEVLLFDLA